MSARVSLGLAVLMAAAMVARASKAVQREIVEIKTAGHLKKTLETNANSFMVILFYSPFCPACTRFHPIYQRAAQKLPAATKELKFVQVNAYSNPGVIPKYRITSLPTVAIYEGGRLADKLDSGSTSQEFLVFNWIKKNTGMPGVVPFFAESSKQTLASNSELDDDDVKTGFAQQDNVLKKESRLAKLLFQETYKDNSLEEKAKELMDGVSLLV
jgi:thioredoxin-like negative regulator of GroEL